MCLPILKCLDEDETIRVVKSGSQDQSGTTTRPNVPPIVDAEPPQQAPPVIDEERLRRRKAREARMEDRQEAVERLERQALRLQQDQLRRQDRLDEQEERRREEIREEQERLRRDREALENERRAVRAREDFEHEQYSYHRRSSSRRPSQRRSSHSRAPSRSGPRVPMPAHIRVGASRRRASPPRSSYPPRGRSRAPAVQFIGDSASSYGSPSSSFDSFRSRSHSSGFRSYSPSHSYSSDYASARETRSPHRTGLPRMTPPLMTTALPNPARPPPVRVAASRMTSVRPVPPRPAPPQAAPAWPTPSQVPILDRGPRKLTTREKTILGIPQSNNGNVVLTPEQAITLAPRWDKHDAWAREEW